MFETRDYNLWTNLQLPFRFVAPASELVVTTHDAKVARTMGATRVHKILAEDYINCEHLTSSTLKSLTNLMNE